MALILSAGMKAFMGLNPFYLKYRLRVPSHAHAGYVRLLSQVSSVEQVSSGSSKSSTKKNTARKQSKSSTAGRLRPGTAKNDDALIIDAAPMLFAQAFRGVKTVDAMVKDLSISLGRLQERSMAKYTALVIDSAGSREEKQIMIDAYREQAGNGGSLDVTDLDFKYKGNRVPTTQSTLVKMTLEALQGISSAQFKVPVLSFPGSEGDDVIATVTKAILERSPTTSVSIMSPDKDFLQLLVSTRVRIYPSPRSLYTGKGIITSESFREDFGLDPRQFVDYLALMGDAVDNVPGVKGVGKVRAKRLLQEFGTLENVIQAAQQGRISGTLGAELARSENVALLSKKLVTLQSDLRLPTLTKDVHSFLSERS